MQIRQLEHNLFVDGFLWYNYTDFGYGACVGKNIIEDEF